MRAIIYARVSRDPQGQARSVDSQIIECREDLLTEGDDEVRDPFTDNDRSASRYASKDRPGFRALVEFLRAGGAGVLYTWEHQRATRRLDGYLELRKLCEDTGVLWRYGGRTHDLRKTADRYATGMDALNAERESDVTHDRVLRGIRGGVANGRPHGKNVYGYRREYAPNDKGRQVLVAQVPDEAQAAIIREIARRVLAGESLFSISRDLQTRRVLPPRGDTWYPETVKRVVTRPTVAGFRTHHGKITGEAAWPAILDRGTWDRVCARLNDPARKTGRPTAVRHLLTGIAKCGVCGAPCRVLNNRGTLAYQCSAPGFHVARNEAEVDRHVQGVVLARLQRADVLEMFVIEDAGVEQAREELAALQARLDGFYDAAAAGEISPQALARIEGQLAPRIADARRRMRKVAAPTVLQDLAGAPDVLDVWMGLSLPQRREVIDTLIEVRILPAGRGRKFDPSQIEIRPKS